MNEFHFNGVKYYWRLNGDKLEVAVTRLTDQYWGARTATVHKHDLKGDLTPHAVCTASYGNLIPEIDASKIWPDLANSKTFAEKHP